MNQPSGRPFVPLKDLVPTAILQFVDSLVLDEYIFTSVIRGIELKWLCLSRRLLWMATGHEYIEPELLNWIDAMPSTAVMYDIGASNGIFSVYAAAKGVSVYAFEPDPSNYFLLSYNNYLNSSFGSNAIKGCMNVAISNEIGIGVINIRKMELGGHEKILDRNIDVFGNVFAPAHTHVVIKYKLDGLPCLLNSANPTHIKIDVDGAEVEVLRGANEVLKNALSVYIELKEASSGPQAHDMLTALGFQLISKHQVQNYEGLHNCIYEKGTI
jgi:FkbM family methyltransferase